MKRKILPMLLLLASSEPACATDLMQAFQQALVSDPTYQQAIAQQLSDKEFEPIARAQLFPQTMLLGGPSMNKQDVANHPELNATTKGYSFTLSVTQTVFNMAQFAGLSSAKATSKAADATVTAALQQLMLRVARAYFNVLKDEDLVSFNRANREAYEKQYDQINQEYKVGLKTITDVYTAKASFDIASAQYIAAQVNLANDRENLRAITGMYYPDIAKLSKRFPLITPHPQDMEAWVHTAQIQNWAIQAALYNAEAAREVVKQQFAGHLPTLNLQGSYNFAYNSNIGSATSSDSMVSTTPGTGTSSTTTSVSQVTGSAGIPLRVHTQTTTVSLNLGVPIYQGGLVVAQTRQAQHNYELATQQLELTIRNIANQTRQSYMSIMAGIQQIEADEQAIKSSQSSFQGLREGYQVGTQTLVDVLNQQQRVFQAENQYANDRYAYVYNLLNLKYAAGTLSQEDLKAINAWLEGSDATPYNSALLEDRRYRYDAKPRYYNVTQQQAPKKKAVASANKNLKQLAMNTSTHGPDFSLTP